MSQADGPPPRASNGPFLAASILAAQPYVRDADIWLGILDLTPDQRQAVFGDAIEPSIVAALASSLLGDCGPIDTRISDSNRNSLDRCSMAMFYPLSVDHGYLGRQDGIDRLTRLMSQSLDEQSFELSCGVYDALCLMSIGDDEPVMRRARENDISNRFVSAENVKRCIEEPSKASEVVWEITREFRLARQAIESSVMFDRDAIEASPNRISPASIPMRGGPITLSVPPIQGASKRVPRNAACPCGSGKKYKKCCGSR